MAERFKYWAILPVNSETGVPYEEHTIRIERARNVTQACQQAFGIILTMFRAKDLGTCRSRIQSDQARITLLRDQTGWVEYISSHNR